MTFGEPGKIDLPKLLGIIKTEVMGWINQAIANAVLTGINILTNVDGQDIKPRSVLADIGTDTATRSIVGVGTFDGNTQSQWVMWNRGTSVGTGSGLLIGVGNPIKYIGGIRANLTNAAAGAEDAILRLRVMRDGSLVEPFSLNVTDGWINLDWGIAFGGVLAPAQITSNQNDYSPTGIGTAAVLRLSSDASRNITGLGDGGPGRTLFIHNVGSQNIVLKDEDTNSAAAGRFALTADFTLKPDMAVMVQYDFTSTRWRIVGNTGGREILTANRTYYVRTDGSDSNNGLANTSGGAWLTLQKAMDVIAATLDFGGYTVTVQIGDGTYNAGLTVKACVGMASPASLVFQGNSGTPANVLISMTSATAFNLTGPQVQCYVKDLKVQTTTGGFCFFIGYGATLYWANINFGATAWANFLLSNGRAAFQGSGGYTISGNAIQHINATGVSYFVCESVGTVTLTGTPAFSGQFCYAEADTTIRINGNTYSGSATGVRYIAHSNAVIFTNGAGATYLPGNSAGSETSGGRYV